MKKRGQAAIEFLMTYGWALIIIVIAIAALFFLGVFSQGTTAACNVDAPFACQEALVLDNAVLVRLKAPKEGTSKVESLNINGEDCPNLIGANLKNSKTNLVRCTGLTLTKEDAVVVNFEVSHNDPGKFKNSYSGKATGDANRGSHVYYDDPDLVLALDFERDAIDISGNNNHGTLLNGMDCTADGKNGRACYFRGRTEPDGEGKYFGDHIEIPDAPSLNLAGDITFEAWLKPEKTQLINSETFQFVDFFSKDWDVLRMILSESGSDNVKIINDIDGTDHSLRSDDSVLEEGKWVHIAWTYDQSEFKMYINGELNGNPVTASGAIKTTTRPVLIGRWGPELDADSGAASKARFYKGAIDDLALYKRALSADEIKAHASL